MLNLDQAYSQDRRIRSIYRIRDLRHSSRSHIRFVRRFNLRCNKKRVCRIMRAIGLKTVIRRKRPNYIKSTPEITAENILNRDFTAKNLNEKRQHKTSKLKWTPSGIHSNNYTFLLSA